jgi:hypothetical protein
MLINPLGRPSSSQHADLIDRHSVETTQSGAPVLL